jgi:hypothetical protein
VHELFASGRAVDLALAAIAVEVFLLLGPFRGRSRLPGWDLLGQLLAGSLLLLSLRCALTGADPRWTGAFLAASFPAHLFDLGRRLRARAREPSPPEA